MLRALSSLTAFLTLAGSVAALAQPATVEFRHPPVGTEIVTTNDTLRVEDVSGFDATLRILRTGRTIGVHAQVFSGPSVGNVLQYDRRTVEGLWPLSVGKTVDVNASRENQVWHVEFKVLRTERVNVPAGTFDTFVIQQRERGIGGNSYRGTTTRWYAPTLGVPVKYEQVIESQNNTTAWQLKQIIHPPGHVAEPPKAEVPAPAQTTPKATSTEPSVSSDAAKRLEQLQRLYDKKLVTPEEYAAKRRAILDSL
jgi:hypothetical protein